MLANSTQLTLLVFRNAFDENFFIFHEMLLINPMTFRKYREFRWVGIEGGGGW